MVIRARASLIAVLSITGMVTATEFGAGGSQALAAGDKIRPLIFLTTPQGGDPQLFQSVQLVAQAWEQLGLDINIRAMPRPQQLNVMWHDRTACGGTGCWDATNNKMTGRPARSDPDEFIFNLYHTSTAASGFNFPGYMNPEYDQIAQAQRSETDKDKRRELVFKAQEILDRDQPNFFLVNPLQKFAFDHTVWDANSMVEQAGLGIRNFWSYIGARPLGDQKDMIINAGEPLRAIHPLFVGGTIASWVQELIWDRLMRINAEGLPEPWAAESYNWVDSTTLDVTLRENMKWHDGTPVTADDVIFTFGEVGDKAPMYTPYTNIIESVTATGPNTVRFVLKEPSAPFLTSTLANVNLSPAHIWRPAAEGIKDSAETLENINFEHPIGSGPYRFVRWKENEELLLERNPDHWAAPKPSRFIVRIVPNMEATLNMLRSGEINFLTHYTGDPDVLTNIADQSEEISLVVSPDIGFEYITTNLRRKPFDDPKFRRALSLAIDRDLILAAAYKGSAVKVNSPISGVLKFWHNPETDGFSANMEEARKILQDAGYELVDGKLHYPDGVSESEATE